MRKFYVFLGLALCCSVALAQPENRVVPNRLLVKFRTGTPAAQAQEALRATGGTWTTIDQIGVHIINAPAQALQGLARNPLVEWVEEDEIVPPALTPNDPQYAGTWWLTNILASSAWDVTTGSTNVTIAICDSGVDSTHPDLAANMVAGWNFYDNNATTTDATGHGTAVAGCAGAIGNNGAGVAGVSWKSKLMPLRISDTNGYAFFSTMAQAVTYAADHACRVANLSYKASDSSAVTAAAQYLNGKGGVLTVAAGNEGDFITSADNPNVLTVTAEDHDTIASWSTTGNNVDLCAPGVAVKTTLRGGTYGSGTGTSFAAPIVAGAAALVIAVNPNLTATNIMSILKNSATDLGTAGWDPIYGYGRLNLSNAVVLAGGVAPPPPSDTIKPTVAITYPLASQVVSNTVGVNVSSSDNVGVVATKLYAGTTLVATSTLPNVTFSWNSKGSADGSVTLAAYAYDRAGNAASNTVAVTVRNATDTNSPTISISAPTSGDVVSNTVSIVMAAADNVAVTRVDCYANQDLIGTSSSASPTFSWDTSKVLNGSYIIKGVATDYAGNSAFATIGVTVDNTIAGGDITAPVVSITSPGAGATVTRTVSVAVTATDAVQVASVTVLVDGASIGTTTTTPYVVRWNTKKAVKGYHLLTATAKDTSGNVGTSASVSVRVQ